MALISGVITSLRPFEWVGSRDADEISVVTQSKMANMNTILMKSTNPSIVSNYRDDSQRPYYFRSSADLRL